MSKRAAEEGVYAIPEVHGATIDRASSPDETSPLLGINDSDDRGIEPLSRKDTWVGEKEFAHLPWYNRPSVCAAARRSKLLMLMMELTGERCSG